MAAVICGCSACGALLAECGPDAFESLRHKLLIRGWAGTMTPAERAYVRAHRPRSDAQRAALAGARARSTILAPKTRVPEGVGAQTGAGGHPTA